jgi:hypothetical protein
MAVDFTPVVGDIKGGVDAYRHPTTANIIAAGAGLFGPLGDALGKSLKEAAKAREVFEVVVDSSRFPEAAKHIDDAQAAGHPSVLTVERSGADARRREATSGHGTNPGRDRDEYPPAFTAEGGKGSSIRSIPSADNRGAGACIGNQCRSLPDGTKVEVKTK